MGLHDVSKTLFFAFFCYVQCGCTQVTTQEDSRSLDQDQSDYGLQSSLLQPALASQQSFKSFPHLHFNQRRRRQALPVNRGNAPPEQYTWNHQFSIEKYLQSGVTSETAYSWQDDTNLLKTIFENNVLFNFLTPTGLRISIPANNINMKIIDFRVKLNQAFQSNSDGSQFVLQRYKSNAMWVYEIPQLRLKSRDKVYYWMRLTLGKENFDTIVKGVLEIKGDIHTLDDTMTFRPSVPVIDRDKPVTWNHEFTVNSKDGNAYTEDYAKRWYELAEFTKRLLEAHVHFKFMNPSGLVITVPDDGIIIKDFQIKLNDEFHENNLGHFTLTASKKDNMWTFYIPQLQVQQGDRVYYQLRIKRGKDALEAFVSGSLKINQGNPHMEISVTSTQAPNWLTQTRPNNYMYPASVAARPQLPVASGQSSPGIDRFGFEESENIGARPTGATQSGAVTFNWEHKFTSYNLNNTPEAGLSQDSANWAMKADEYFKKNLKRGIKFDFLNPIGLKMTISGDDDNLRILTFNVKLNEEFNEFGEGGLQAIVTRLNDGRWSYYYPSLKLSEGDNVYYWMKVTFTKERWLYLVKGNLEVTQGDPHNNVNPIHTTTTSPQSSYAVHTKPPAPASLAGLPVQWDHKYRANRKNSEGFNLSPSEQDLLRNMFQKQMDFRFLNPSGLRILFSDKDKEFVLLALNIKLNEPFDSLDPGHYIANVTRARDGRIDYYYPNLKIKPGDTAYYWMRVLLGSQMMDYVVRGELKLIQGDPHLGGQIPDVPPPTIWSQVRPLPTEAPRPVQPPTTPNTVVQTSSPNTQPTPFSPVPPQGTISSEVEPLSSYS